MKTTLLIAIICLLPSCETVQTGDQSPLQQVHGYVGTSNVAGAEIHLGRSWAVGLGGWVRKLPDWKSPPQPAPTEFYAYPINEK